MASLTATGKLTARLLSRKYCQHVSARGFRSSATKAAAHEFTMPAMSPTMTEGNIASWKVKEGDSFSAGDVLLEIETDKAQMDVEAQDEGIMAKIIQPDGSKSVKVGTRIAVTADPDDDLSTLSLPAEDSALIPSPRDETESGVDRAKSSESQAEAPPSSKGIDTPSLTSSESSSDKSLRTSSEPSKPSGKPQKQRYPLYPSVAQLLHEKGIPSSEVEKIPASGPKGRLLKGDVLAYLGAINASYPSEQSARLSKLSHLDLSNIKIAPPKQMPPPSAPSTPEKASTVSEPIPSTDLAIQISLNAVLDVQRRIQTTLGVTLPISTFFARAAELANDDLPRSMAAKPSADELFNQVLGLDKVVSKTSRGNYMPQIIALPPQSPSAPVPKSKGVAKETDIIDILSGNVRSSSSSASRKGVKGQEPGMAAVTEPTTKFLSMTVPKGEEKRAKVFLERMKSILQVEPGRLIL